MNDIPAILLAGGLGTRLWGVTNDKIPKSLVNVAGKTILERVLDNLLEAGVTRACLAVGHKSVQIQEFFGDSYRGMQLFYSNEDSPLGTGGAALKASLDLDWGTALVVNADTFIAIPLTEMALALNSNSIGILLTTIVKDASRYGALRIDSDRVTSFMEKSSASQGYIYAGVTLLNFRKMQKTLKVASGSFSFESQVLAPLAAEGQLNWLRAKGKFIDIGTTESFEAAQNLFEDDNK